ncbi:MAG TPA: glycoside hydrolase family 2 TIM barrel-domain containing protein [Solirubrobacterales bacterium]|nr:glycoside hydrolase family 2 TIM barrel-domain containing protein [Solirubrobacterales bacterium]
MSRFAGTALLCSLLVCVAATPAAAADRPKPGSVYRDGPSGRYLLDGEWHQRADPADAGIAQRFQSQESLAGWAPTRVPNASNAGNFSNESYLGTVHWYRKDFRLPRASAVAKWVLRFESVNYRARVWLNGKPLGIHVGAYLPFELRAKSVRRKGVNRLVVRVDSRRQKFDIPPLSQRASGAFEGGWWNYNGILREVYLRRVDTFDFQRVAYEPSLRCRTCAATVRVLVTVKNFNTRGATARITGRFAGRNLRFRAHRVPGRGESRFRARVRIRNPRLWSPERPTLHTGRLQLRTSSGRIVQKHTVHTGIRVLRVSRLGRIQLNFRDVNLRGASMHEDSLSRGAALTPAQMRENIGHLRDLRATITRSHYPFHPYTLELADRYGILVWSEIPVFRMASRLFAISEVRNKALRMLRTEIARDANHPSVIVWSIGNENASRPGTGLRKYIRKAERTVKDLDPTRLIGLATSGFPTVEKQPIYLELDVLGINDYFGWYNGPRGTIADRNQLSGYLNRLHSDYPNQALVITEFGAEANRSGPVTEKGTFEFQAEWLRYHLDVFATKPFVSGALIWNLRDFRVKPGWAGGNPLPHPPVNEKGLIDDFGRKKPAYSIVRGVYLRTGPFR